MTVTQSRPGLPSGWKSVNVDSMLTLRGSISNGQSVGNRTCYWGSPNATLWDVLGEVTSPFLQIPAWTLTGRHVYTLGFNVDAYSEAKVGLAPECEGLPLLVQ